jgi:KDO2-lipid IV(A) lauroyltransferase
MALLFRLLGRLPLRLLQGFGAFFGWVAYLASPTYRRHTRENLALAYGPDEAAAILPAAVAHAGRGVLELPWLWTRPKAEVVGLVTQVTGWELIEAAWQRGDGILFFTPHLGCFEITAQYVAARAPITVLYRKPKQAWLQPLIESGRGSANFHLAPADLSGVRLLLKALKRHEAVGMLPDQVPGMGEGQWADFFGRPAYTMTLGARLSETARTTVLMAFAERLPGGCGYLLRFSAPTQVIDGSLEARTLGINRALEDLIRSCPQQYLWGYNRYKAPRGAAPPPAQG